MDELPQEEDLAAARASTLREKKMWVLLRDICLNVFFVLVLIVMAYGTA